MERNDGVLDDGAERRTIPTLPGRWRDCYANISAALNHGAAPMVRFDELRRQIAVLEAGQQSADTGEVVRPAIPALLR
ncbi:MAG: hypothetical protein NTW86_17380 [Candidatus Sumerlaeota bacterium]|nr:hypothetical protein [Candidatus Sumerlaeota bacterium]